MYIYNIPSYIYIYIYREREREGDRYRYRADSAVFIAASPQNASTDLT